MYELIFFPETEIEIFDSYQWYEEQKDGLGEQFVTEVERTIKRIKKNPLHYALLNKEVRQTLVDVFPFVVAYQIDEEQKVIFILSIFHTSRNPRFKIKRKPSP